ncbi:hypothetical protein KJ836_03525 [Patescibacteria group bacterium]|nr:hypothetical protein [Patescibacteria group bacterium]
MKRNKTYRKIVGRVKKNPAVSLLVAFIVLALGFIYLPQLQQLKGGDSQAFDGKLINPGFNPDSSPLDPTNTPGGDGPSDLEDFTLSLSPTSATVHASEVVNFMVTTNRVGGYTGDIYLNFKPLYWTWIESAEFSDSTLSYDEDSSILTITMKNYVESSTVPFYAVGEGEGMLGEYKYAHGVLDVIANEPIPTTRIVWDSSGDIYMYDLSTGVETQITTNPKEQRYPNIYGDKIVWEDYRNNNLDNNSDIYMYDLSNGIETQITTDESSQTFPTIDNNRIIWTDNRNGNSDIYMYDLFTNEEIQITTNESNQWAPAINGNIIVWSDWRNDIGNANCDIYMYNLSTNTETQITTDESFQAFPDIYENKFVWEDKRNGNFDIYTYDLNTGVETQITNDISDQRIPNIYNNWIVWQDSRNITIDNDWNYDIYAYNLTTNAEYQITTDENQQISPYIYGNEIVWQDYRNGNWDIYLYNLLTNEEIPITTSSSNQSNPAIFIF